MEKEPIISQREVQRKYKKLMDDVATSEYYKVDLTNQVNCYTCRNGHITKTRHAHPGTTTMMIACPTCDFCAQSSFYRDIAPEMTPTQEWYRPTLEECLKMRKNIHALDHVLMGGLLKRSIDQPIKLNP